MFIISDRQRFSKWGPGTTMNHKTQSGPVVCQKEFIKNSKSKQVASQSFQLEPNVSC